MHKKEQIVVGQDAPNMDHDYYKAQGMSFNEWMSYGIKMGWCGPPVCYTHDGLPTSPAEDEEFEEHDPCVHIVRLYEDDEHRQAIEESHSPSQWRNHYR
jgi:hypothetical protein